ncbi:hypothetical protein AeMF1_018226 [Aphanomyces euteiches]|nr:hypothetical protein AeMF1_018226 [Aphanomyces euteiches]
MAASYHVVHGAPIDLFNAPITEAPLILDTRSKESFYAAHVSGAVRCLSLADLQSKLTAPDAPWDTSCALRQIYVIGDTSVYPPLVYELQEHDIDIGKTTFSSCTLKIAVGYTTRRPGSIVYLGDFHAFDVQFPMLVSRNTLARFDDRSSLASMDVFCPSMIAEWGLYLGSVSQASSRAVLSDLNISLVINVSIEVPNFFESSSGIDYVRLAVEDTNAQDMTEAWQTSCAAIRKAKECRRQVLVHCHAGRSRSVSCIVFFLMQCERMRLDDAFRYVQARRAQARPNAGFMRQLLIVDNAATTTWSQ